MVTTTKKRRPSDPFLDLRCEEGRTDIANAKRFATMYGETMFYVHPLKAWHYWDHRRWKPDEDGEAGRRASRVVETIWKEARELGDGGTKREAIQWAGISAGSSRLNAMLKLAQDQLPMPLENLNRDPFLLNCKNCTIDLRTGEPRSHCPSDYLTTLCPTSFDDEPSELFEKFISDIFCGRDDLIRWVQRYLGYCLTGSTQEDVLAIWHGSGGNGKTTLLELIFDVLGPDYAAPGAPDLLFAKSGDAHPTDKADLYGKRFVACSETGAHKWLDEELVKRLTGGDKIKARRLYENYWSFTPTHKLSIISNHKPNVRNLDDAMRRRLRLIPFDARFTNPDRSLRSRLRDDAPAILTWLVQGCMEWGAKGLNSEDCEAVHAATEGYFQEQDVIGLFIAEGCILNPLMKVRGRSFFDSLEEWCNETGHAAPGSRKTGEYMRSRFETKTSNGTWYLGLGLKS